MKEHTWSARSEYAAEILGKIISYLQAQPVGSEKWSEGWNEMDTLLELIYQLYTEFNSVETPEFKAIVDPLDRTLRDLVETDEEADQYMNVVFELCTAYERQGYIEGMKVGVKLLCHKNL